MSVDAETRAEAVVKMKAQMNEDAISAHMMEKHPNEPIISVSDCHAMIEQGLEPQE